MKFKSLFFLFNAVLLVSFAFVFLMPLPVLGWEYASTFWGQNWYVALVFVAVLVVLDGYFAVNWRLYSLLEREEWDALLAHLETKLEKNGALGVQQARVYINASLIRHDPKRIDRLREKLSGKPVAARLALSLALPLVLEGKPEPLEAFLSPYAQKKGPEGEWIRWSLGFGALLNHNTALARDRLLPLMQTTRSPLVGLLAAYLLSNLTASDPKLEQAVQACSTALRRVGGQDQWTAQVDRWKERITLVLFMGQLITQARQWLDKGEGEQP